MNWIGEANLVKELTNSYLLIKFLNFPIKLFLPLMKDHLPDSGFMEENKREQVSTSR
jgi:hypothetical protein